MNRYQMLFPGCSVMLQREKIVLSFFIGPGHAPVRYHFSLTMFGSRYITNNIQGNEMTYCVAINTNTGFVVCSDSRTNAGFDHISSYRKTHTFVWPNNRVFALLSAGNLATTQLVIKRLNADLDNRAVPNLLSVKTMQEAADYVAAVNISVQTLHVVRDTGNTSFEATFILAGQIGTAIHETLLIYPQGNYIHESDEHPYLQIGETKYGKPILDRVISRNMLLERAGRCALVSMNSTVRSNLTVGPPIDLLVYEKGSLNFTNQLYLAEDNPFAKQLSEQWNEGLILALQNLPKFYWENSTGNTAVPDTNANQPSSKIR